jgi:hypothetical protein
MAAVGNTTLLASCRLSAIVATVALAAIAVGADTEHAGASVATPWAKHETRHLTIISLRCAPSMMLMVHS